MRTWCSVAQTETPLPFTADSWKTYENVLKSLLGDNSFFFVFNNIQVKAEYEEFNHIKPDPGYIKVKVHGFT